MKNTKLPPAVVYTSGCLSEEWLDALEQHQFSLQDGAQFLVHELPIIVARMIQPTICVRKALSEFSNNPVISVRVASGGWSEAETLLGILVKKPAFAALHTRWERGGVYEFEIPFSLLDPATVPTSANEESHV